MKPTRTLNWRRPTGRRNWRSRSTTCWRSRSTAWSQQAATFAANNETLQAEEAAQGKQIADIQEQLVSLSGRADEFASADEASVEDLDALAAQLGTFAAREDLAALEAQMGTFATAEDEADQDAQLADVAQQIDDLGQQAATFAANNETLQAEEAAQGKQIADIQEQLVSLSGRADEFASADEASVEDLDALAAQLDGPAPADQRHAGTDRHPEPADRFLCQHGGRGRRTADG
jgi:chromosome segregation ATPase